MSALLARLAERESGGALKWIRASLGAAMKLIPVEDVLYFQAEDKYTKVVTAEADAARTPAPAASLGASRIPRQ